MLEAGIQWGNSNPVEKGLALPQESQNGDLDQKKVAFRGADNHRQPLLPSRPTESEDHQMCLRDEEITVKNAMENASDTQELN